jgi:hypothetical protein
MSLNAQNAASQEPVYEGSDSIATTGRFDALSGNFESSEQAGSVSTNESVQTGAGKGVSKVDHPNPAQTQLTEVEIERRAYQGFEKPPNIQDTYDSWRYHPPTVRNLILRKARQAEEALAHGEGNSFQQDRQTVATADKTSILTGASSTCMDTSSVSRHGVEIKREIEEETVPRRSRRNKGSRYSAAPLGLAISASTKGHLGSKVVKRETRPRRKRLDNRRKALGETGIKQEEIKQKLEDDAAVSLKRNVAPPYENIADGMSFAQEVSDAFCEEKKKPSEKQPLTF